MLVWKAILAAVLSLSGYRYLGDGGTNTISVKFCIMVHIGPGQIFSPFWSGTSGEPQIRNFGPNFWSLTANISETVSRSVTCQLELNISSTRAF